MHIPLVGAPGTPGGGGGTAVYHRVPRHPAQCPIPASYPALGTPSLHLPVLYSGAGTHLTVNSLGPVVRKEAFLCFSRVFNRVLEKLTWEEKEAKRG